MAKLLTPETLPVANAARVLKTTVKDIKQRIANGEFVTEPITPNVIGIKFYKTNGTPKYIPFPRP